jgi:hypothetical protein
MDGHGTSPLGRCEGRPDPSEVSSLGKLSVFSQSPIGTLGRSFIMVLGMLASFSVNVFPFLYGFTECLDQMYTAAVNRS